MQADQHGGLRPGSIQLVDGGTLDLRPVVVVGATGKTGRAVAEALLARRVPVRAAVRAGREAAAPAGTTPVAIDLATGSGLAVAFDGARAAYHLAPNVHPDEVGIARRVADVAGVTGLPRLVFHSVLRPDDARMPHHLRKAEAEALLRDAVGDRLVVLRPAAYHQNLVAQARSGMLAVPVLARRPVHQRRPRRRRAGGRGRPPRRPHRPDPRPRRPGGAHDAADDRGGGDRPGPPGERHADLVGAVADRPGAALTEQARHDLAAMFTAYDDGGLVGDTSVLPGLLGRAPVTWTTCVSQTR